MLKTTTKGRSLGGYHIVYIYSIHTYAYIYVYVRTHAHAYANMVPVHGGDFDFRVARPDTESDRLVSALHPSRPDYRRGRSGHAHAAATSFTSAASTENGSRPSCCRSPGSAACASTSLTKAIPQAPGRKHDNVSQGSGLLNLVWHSGIVSHSLL